MARSRNDAVERALYECAVGSTRPMQKKYKLKRVEYNEETGTFDGTLTFRKDEYSVFDIPYGYSFVYDDYSNLDNVVSLEQIAAQLQERASSWSEAEAFEMPPRIDMDELEVRLLNSDKYEEYEKQVIRILAASRNELHDAYTEFFAALKEIPVDETGLTVADMGDLSMIMPTVQPFCPGSKGTAHGMDYYISDPVAACVENAKFQLAMLTLLLSDEAERAKKIIEGFKPQFESKEAFLSYVDSLYDSGDRIEYNDDGTAKVRI